MMNLSGKIKLINKGNNLVILAQKSTRSIIKFTSQNTVYQHIIVLLC